MYILIIVVSFVRHHQEHTCIYIYIYAYTNTNVNIYTYHCCLICTSPSRALLYNGAIINLDHRSSSNAESQHKLPIYVVYIDYWYRSRIIYLYLDSHRYLYTYTCIYINMFIYETLNLPGS
jgi:hypothetical protein